ncbi:TlpA family protein disulfide reductase [Ornithobacterium rhinotracheale]|uniref:Thiol-disulfide isomerase-like thioredoxin n=1 Tax=Ornithobacterium rhinotracheale (strain ATCC 51463 / DSM 15997 / CCUG 23171 / CIP 104009 / LMG 9086) TaxID=867902 RepID=I4A3C0_ORNRL|nr:TlpA disulfide reductase family protein [Ornithobacterium rhinotracheale]AFL98454.1 thiol-disulfide isomerase-like thioredoxin [Ornithobacterium rhinotracheale DSM 15997]AIQ00181.1 alkyl hydroperoxide reductase [Ornithobacterium rhinotracheale ORT-UMN 88]KGB65873.1 hypothetical protein Q787_11300 [Ornithobacterium rhinotracheale H06-030791]MBN3662880.1 TlpA family protein disulfide reductase [Ornithobacterium rhinotracheale]MCK0193196.1 TlpA family protein disulfide reductase [Ornithobacter
MRKLFLIIFSILALNACKAPEPKFEEGQALQTSQLDLDLEKTTGEELNLKNIQKPIFLHFWGSWCPPCKAEMPSIEKLYQKYGDKVEFILIPINDKPEKYQAFLNENNINVPVYEAKSLIDKDLMPKAFPTTYIIDKDKKVVKEAIGMHDWEGDDLQQLFVGF